MSATDSLFAALRLFALGRFEFLHRHVPCGANWRYSRFAKSSRLSRHWASLDVSRHLRAVRGGSSINKGEEMTTSVETAAIHAREAEVYEFVQALRNSGGEEPALSVAAGNYRRVLAERDRWRDRLAEVFARDNPGGFWNDLNSDIEQDAETGHLRFRERFGSAMPPSARRSAAP